MTPIPLRAQEDVVTEDTQGRAADGKVARVLAKYDIEAFGDEMAARWARDDDGRMSLRELATAFNQRLLETRMRAVGLQSLDGEVENVYRLLTADDVGRAEQTRAKRRLERAGVDTEQLLDDFVSYQSIRTYLRDVQDVEHGADDGSPVESSRRTIRRLDSRVRTITESRLDQLDDADHLSLDAFRVYVDVQVVCESCGSQYDVETLLDQGGCPCADE